MHALTHWEFAALVVWPLLISAVLYAIGLARLWRKAGAGRITSAPLRSMSAWMRRAG